MSNINVVSTTALQTASAWQQILYGKQNVTNYDDWDVASYAGPITLGRYLELEARSRTQGYERTVNVVNTGNQYMITKVQSGAGGSKPKAAPKKPVVIFGLLPSVPVKAPETKQRVAISVSPSPAPRTATAVVVVGGGGSSSRIISRSRSPNRPTVRTTPLPTPVPTTTTSKVVSKKPPVVIGGVPIVFNPPPPVPPPKPRLTCDEVMCRNGGVRSREDYLALAKVHSTNPCQTADCQAEWLTIKRCNAKQQYCKAAAAPESVQQREESEQIAAAANLIAELESSDALAQDNEDQERVLLQSLEQFAMDIGDRWNKTANQMLKFQLQKRFATVLALINRLQTVVKRVFAGRNDIALALAAMNKRLEVIQSDMEGGEAAAS